MMRTLFGLCLLFVGCVRAQDWQAWVDALPRTVLREEYQPTCHRPLEYLGFSFTYPDDELAQIKATGANALTLGAMWVPVQDPDAPYGCGYHLPGGLGILEQSFVAKAPFDAVAPCLPTGTSTDSGCSWTLFHADGQGAPADQVAEGTWPLAKDNAWDEATFDPQPPGRYLLRVHSPTGSWMGWWGRDDDPYPDGQARLAGRPAPGTDLELRLRSGGQWTELVPPSPEHHAYHLGPGEVDRLRRFGLVAPYSLGDWNNPGFPYLADWFNDRFPDAMALDQDGKPFLGGMFERQVPAPGIEHPVFPNGGTRFIQAVVDSLRDEPTVLYWVMGGEAMYADYGNFSRHFDYSDLALRHFRAWLAAYRYRAIAALNQAWGATFAGFDAVQPPRAPAPSQAWLDWNDFRFQSMGERFAWHYRAARSRDPKRLIVTCNHGTIYVDGAYTALGARPEMYAANSDGWETGQIMTDADPELYDLIYIESLGSLGKPYCPTRLAYKKSDPKARGGGTSYTPETARRYLYESLGADAWQLGLIQWSGSLPDGEWGVAGTPAEQAIAELFGEVHRLQPRLEDMHAVKPRVGVFLSHPTWALLGFQPSWQQLHNAAVERQVPKLYVYDEQLKSGEADDFATLVLLDDELVDPDVLPALDRYLKGGGKLVIAGPFAARSPSGTLAGESARLRQSILDRATVCPEDAERILDALGDECVPVEIESDGTATRLAETNVAPRAEDWPQDLTSAASLGQTVKVDRDGLASVSIRTPTYYHTPPAGFHFEARRDGPTGELLAQTDVPAGVGDNSWQTLDLAQPPAAGTTLYLRATPDPALPATNLGWWSTHRDDYADGTAYVADQPVAGDRQVRLTYHEPVPAARRVESFVLSDGLDYGVVLINVSHQPVRLSVDLSRLLSREAPAGYQITAPLLPDAWQADGLRGRLALPAHGATMLYAACQVSRNQAQSLLAEATRAAESWRAAGALTPFAEYAGRRAEEQFAAGQWAKSAAMSLKVLAGLGLSAEVNVVDGGLAVRGRCLDAAGRPVAADGATCELVPTPMFWREANVGAAGSIRLDLTRSDLPPRWDYEAGKYVPLSGPLRIRLAVQAGGRRAGVLLDTVVPP